MAIEAPALASLDDLEVRLEFPLDDDHLKEMAGAYLVDASILVREYGLSTWTADTAPPIAVTLTLKAAARAMNNPMLLETARGADETNMWGSDNANGVHLTPNEIDLLREHRKENRVGFQSVPTNLFSSRPAPAESLQGYFPVDSYGDGTAKWFPDYMPGDVYRPYYPEAMR